MDWFIYLVGVIWIGVGAVYILYTEEARDTVRMVLKRYQRQVFAVVALIIGALLVAAAFFSHKTWLVAILGGLALAKSAYLFFNPGNTYEALVTWYLKATDQTYRLFGMIMVVLGTALISLT